MSQQDGTPINYEFTSLVTFANGKRSEFKKKESLRVEEKRDGYVFTFLGSTEETLQNKPVDDVDEIVLQFGKALYPLSMQVSKGFVPEKLVDYPVVKERWLKYRKEMSEKCDYNYFINKELDSYELVLSSEERLFSTLIENMLYKLFFWQMEADGQELVIRDFPAWERLAIFKFNRPKKENGSWVFESLDVHDEGSGHLLSGRATINYTYGDDNLPEQIVLWARVEEENIGYFTKQITIKRVA